MESPRDPREESLAQILKTDAPAGLVVFLVALPLCLGIALASEAPLVSGIVSGVVAGILVSWLSGSQLAVSGPAAGLTVLVAGGIAELGSFEAFLAVVVMGGMIQVAAGLLRVGFLAEFFPVSVIKGMLAGIGIILILKQIPHALGRDHDYEGDLSFWVPGGDDNTFTEIATAVYTMSPGVVVITLACLAVMVLWEQPFIRDASWSRIVPGPLAAVALGIVINQLYGATAPNLYVSAEAGHLVEIPVFGTPGELWASLPRPDLSYFTDERAIGLAFALAAIASVETLLCVEAADKLDPLRRVSPMNRELVAQGVGNVTSGLLGGLPMTAVIVRSSANVYSGGRTRLSSFVHGVLLFVMVVSVPSLLNMIPLASLAAVLLVIGYRLARVSLFKEMYASGLDQFLPFLVTVVATVLTDLLTGVGIGFVVGVVMVIQTNYHSAITVVHEDGTYLLRFTKDVSFLNKTTLKRVLAGIPDGSHVILDGTGAMFIDKDITAVIDDFVASASWRHIEVEARNLESKAFPLRLPQTS